MNELVEAALPTSSSDPWESDESTESAEILGNSPAILEVKKAVARVAPTDATVLLTGETGTGKDLVATSIHRLSSRRDRAFVAVNCSALSPHLLESEIFGHEQGSFTGASRRHAGYFERANHGTIFLDEITEMPIELQPKLLRLLESGSFMRVGGDTEIRSDVRVVAASNRRPADAVREGTFRQDLLYRLSVFPITLPPLRERGDDVLVLAEHFLSLVNSTARTTKRLTATCRNALRSHVWPGNVRELYNLVRRACILADSEIDADCFFPAEATEEDEVGLKVPFGVSLAEAKKQIILATLERCHGHRGRTAEALGVSPKTLYNHLFDYGVISRSAAGLNETGMSPAPRSTPLSRTSLQNA